MLTIGLVVVLGDQGCSPTASAPAAAAPTGAEGRGAPGSPPDASAASAPRIVLPDILAIELPAPGMTEIAPSASPLRELLESASAGELMVTHDQSAPLPVGATRVTWTAWSGPAGSSSVHATRAAYVYVFPFGQTPAGISRDTHATVGNHSPKVVRDGSGAVHVVWLDAERPGVGPRVMYRRGIQDPSTGGLRWETEPLRVSDGRSEIWNSYPAIEGSDRAVHFAWYGGRTTRYRRLVRTAEGWSFEPIRDTGASGHIHDNGPDIATRGDDEIHIVTPSGAYALSRDGGVRWTLDQVPPLPRGRIKMPALAVDRQGNAHVAFTGQVRSAPSFSLARPNGGYWELRYVRRRAGGGWVDAQDVLAALPEWRDHGAERDILADFVDIAMDGRGHIHLGWHGTVNTYIFGQDEAFYVRRPARNGSWGPIDAVQPLHPIDPAASRFVSYTPSLCVDDEADLVLAVVFFATDRHLFSQSQLFDSAVRVVRGGRVEGPPIPLSTLSGLGRASGSREALSTWFPSAGPRLFRPANGRAWLDVLHTVVTPAHHNSPYYIVYQRREVTSLLAGARAGGR